MITLYTYKEFYGSKVTHKLPLQCEFCSKTFYQTKRRIQSALRCNGKDKCCFCSKSCASKSKLKKIEIQCSNCHNKFFKNIKKIRDENFCSKSCASKNRLKNKNQ